MSEYICSECHEWELGTECLCGECAARYRNITIEGSRKVIRLNSLNDLERDNEGCYIFEQNAIYIFDQPAIVRPVDREGNKSNEYQEVHGGHNGMAYPK